MNRTAGVLAIILAIIVIGGVAYYATDNNIPSETATSTPTGTGGTEQTNTNVTITYVPETRQGGMPIVVTNSNAIPTDTTVVLTGNIIPNGAFTTYWYEYGLTANLGLKAATQLLGSGYVNYKSPSYITGLAKNTTYFYRLVAENQFGKVAGNQYSFKTTSGVAVPVGSAPISKTLAATGISRNTANLNGEVTPNMVMTEYWFEFGKTANLGNTTALSSVGSGSAKVSESISLSNLSPATTYYFRINAQNQFGTVNGGILNFTTSGPVSVTGAPNVSTEKATAVTGSSAKLHGNVNPNGRETTYWFEYSTDSLLGSVLLKETNHIVLGSGSDNASVSTDIASLASKTTYYFRIVGENNLGTSRGERLTLKTK